MAIPVYLFLTDDGGSKITGAVDIRNREGSIEVTGQSLNTAELRWYRINDTGQEVEYYNMHLDNIHVVSVTPLMYDTKDPTKEKHNHLEVVELRYDKISWTYCDGNLQFADSGIDYARRSGF
jgi:type VI secretion system secreted protein Hcp